MPLHLFKMFLLRQLICNVQHPTVMSLVTPKLPCGTTRASSQADGLRGITAWHCCIGGSWTRGRSGSGLANARGSAALQHGHLPTIIQQIWKANLIRGVIRSVAVRPRRKPNLCGMRSSPCDEADGAQAGSTCMGCQTACDADVRFADRCERAETAPENRERCERNPADVRGGRLLLPGRAQNAVLTPTTKQTTLTMSIASSVCIALFGTSSDHAKMA